jgi:hypothetical protein
MEDGVPVDRNHTQAGLGIPTQSGMSAQTLAQGSVSAIWLSTFTCG